MSADINERGIDERSLAPSAIGDYLRLPQTRGIIESFVGPNPTFDHDFTHHLKAHSTYLQPLHVDAITDSPDTTSDVQLLWYPHDVAPGEGGTRFVPGSHPRRVRSSGYDRYQHMAGEQQYSGPAGTVVVFHHGLGHAGRPTPGDRWMPGTDLDRRSVRLSPVNRRSWSPPDARSAPLRQRGRQSEGIRPGPQRPQRRCVVSRCGTHGAARPSTDALTVHDALDMDEAQDPPGSSGNGTSDQ